MRAYDHSFLKNVQKNVGFFFAAYEWSYDDRRAYTTPDTPEYIFVNSNAVKNIEKADVGYLLMDPLDFYTDITKPFDIEREKLYKEKEEHYLEIIPDLREIRQGWIEERHRDLVLLSYRIDSYNNLAHVCKDDLTDNMRVYWAGTALATYQWYSNHSFFDILSKVPFCEIVAMSYGYATDPTFDECIEDMDRRYNKL